MRRFLLLSLLAIGCAHAPPPVEVAENRTAFASMTVVREAVAEMALGTRPATEFTMMMLLNAEPTKLGVLTTSGTSVDNTTTAVPFGLTCGGDVLMFQCDAGGANVGGGSTCDATVTGANHKKQIADAWAPYYMLRKSTTICLDAAAATNINCAVFCMQ